MNTIPNGWFPDPEDTSQWRYFDGQRWTDSRAPRDPRASQAPQALGPPAAPSAGTDAAGHVALLARSAPPTAPPPPPPQKNWFWRHKVTTTLLAILTVVVLAAIGYSGSGTSTNSDGTRQPATTSNSNTGQPGSTQQQAPDKATKPAPSYTTGQEQAIGAAKDYLAYAAFSKAGLIDQLSSQYGEGFKRRDAVFAVNHIAVNWNQQAVKAAKEYLAYEHFSRAGLIDQLSSEYGDGFTRAQAVYAANHVGF